MANVQEIVVELLRHGPAHNQLLSPLTDYLALVGDHAAETLNVPFEHHQFLHRLRAVRYESDDADRRFELEELGRIVSDMLGRLPGLVASLADRSVRQDAPLHLRLMLSSAELSLLPFELANMPSGVPGAGKPLLLQPLRPVCVTRRVRRVTREGSYWSGRPKLLFAAAAPPGVAGVPAKEHLMALRDAIDPWLSCSGSADELGRHLVFVPNATVRALEEACREYAFTHVHILAHGVEKREGEGLHYGLALHDETDPEATDVVTGERLAAALRVYRKQAERGHSAPAMVTIASCHSAQQGSVVGAGASVAHHLHEAGIPMVVASQFPLSVRGSVIMTQLLYKRLLWGTDPRVALTDLRRRLFSLLPECHDWASLVVYDAFPEDLDDRQAEIGIQQANDSIKAALNCADRAMADGRREKDETLRNALDKLQDRTRRLEALIDVAGLDGGNRTAALGMLASAEKRQAQLHYRLSVTGNHDTKHSARSLELVERAMDHYRLIFQEDVGSHWAIIQFLSLYGVLNHSERAAAVAGRCRHDVATLLAAARLAAEIKLERGAPLERIWACGSLAELAILRVLFGTADDLGKETGCAQEFLQRMLAVPEPNVRGIYATVHQLRRYWDWYVKIADDAFGKTLARFGDVERRVNAIRLPVTLDY